MDDLLLLALVSFEPGKADGIRVENGLDFPILKGEGAVFCEHAAPLRFIKRGDRIHPACKHGRDFPGFEVGKEGGERLCGRF